MNTDEITIRDLIMQESDLRQILEIENYSFKEEDAYTREDFQRWFSVNPDFCVVAEIDGKIVGDMICRIKRYRLDLGSCAIHPDYRRRGVGAAILREMEKRARRMYEARLVNEASDFSDQMAIAMTVKEVTDGK